MGTSEIITGVLALMGGAFGRELLRTLRLRGKRDDAVEDQFIGFLKDELARNRTELNELRERVVRVESANQQLKTDYDKVLAENAALRAENSTLRQELEKRHV